MRVLVSRLGRDRRLAPPHRRPGRRPAHGGVAGGAGGDARGPRAGHCRATEVVRTPAIDVHEQVVRLRELREPGRGERVGSVGVRVEPTREHAIRVMDLV